MISCSIVKSDVQFSIDQGSSLDSYLNHHAPLPLPLHPTSHHSNPRTDPLPDYRVPTLCADATPTLPRTLPADAPFRRHLHPPAGHPVFIWYFSGRSWVFLAPRHLFLCWWLNCRRWIWRLRCRWDPQIGHCQLFSCWYQQINQLRPPGTCILAKYLRFRDGYLFYEFWHFNILILYKLIEFMDVILIIITIISRKQIAYL